MGSLSVNQAESLIKKGILKKDTVENLQKEGVVSKRRRNTRRYVKTKQGNLVLVTEVGYDKWGRPDWYNIIFSTTSHTT